MGEIAAAARLKEEVRIPFPLLVDRSQESYKVLGLARGSMMQLIGPEVVKRGIRSWLAGHRTVRPREDPLQLGGALVVAPSGLVLFEHHNQTSADHPPVEKMLDSIPASHPQSP
jgi:AhpC/TSA antioxidant enzyme